MANELIIPVKLQLDTIDINTGQIQGAGKTVSDQITKSINDSGKNLDLFKNAKLNPEMQSSVEHVTKAMQDLIRAQTEYNNVLQETAAAGAKGTPLQESEYNKVAAAIQNVVTANNELRSSTQSLNQSKLSDKFTDEFNRLLTQMQEIDKEVEKLNNDTKIMGKEGATSDQWKDAKSSAESYKNSLDDIIEQMKELMRSGQAFRVSGRASDILPLMEKSKTYNAIKDILDRKPNVVKQQKPIDVSPRERSIAAWTRLKNVMYGVRTVASATGNIIRSVGSALSNTAKGISSGFKNAGSHIKSLISKLRNLTHHGKSSNKTFANLKKTVLQLGLGFRSMYFLIRRMRTTIKKDLGIMAQAFPEVNEPLSKLLTTFNQLKGTLGTVAQPLLNIFIPALNTLMQELTEVGNKIAQFFAAFTGQKYIYKAISAQKDFANEVNKTKDKLAQYDQLLVINKDEDENGGISYEKVEADADGAMTKYQELIDALHHLGSEISTTFKDIKSSLSGTFEDFEPLLTSVIDRLARRIGEIRDGIKKAFEGVNIKDDVYQMLQTIGDTIDSIILALQPVMQTVLPQIWGWIKNIVTTAGPIITDVVTTLAPHLSDFADRVFPVLNDNVEPILSALGNFIKTVGPKFLDFFAVIIEKLVPILPKLINSATKIFDAVLPPLTRIVEALIPVIADNIDPITDFLVTAADTILPVIADIVEQLAPFLSDIIKEMMPWLSQLLKDMEPYFKDFVDNMLPDILQMIKDLQPDIQDFVSNSLPIIFDIIKKLMPHIISFTKKFLPRILDLVEMLLPVIDSIAIVLDKIWPVLEWIIQLLIDIAEPIVNVILGVFSLGTEAEGAKSKFADAIETITNMLANILNFMTDIVNGIISAVEWCVNGITHLINKFIGGLNSALGFLGVNIPEIQDVAISRIPKMDVTDFNSAVRNWVMNVGMTTPSNAEFQNSNQYWSNVAGIGNIDTEALKNMLTAAQSRQNTANNPVQSIVLQLDGKTVAETVWNENEKKYKQTGNMSYAY